MSDNEIIKALKICNTIGASCKDCPAFVKDNRSNCKEVLLGAITLIDRQKSEIERLKGSTIVNNIMESLRIKREAKVEAYKEFAERLKNAKRLGQIGRAKTKSTKADYKPKRENEVQLDRR